jgi:hypothetical protein
MSAACSGFIILLNYLLAVSISTLANYHIS